MCNVQWSESLDNTEKRCEVFSLPNFQFGTPPTVSQQYWEQGEGDKSDLPFSDSLTRSRALPGNALGEALPHTLPEAEPPGDQWH